MRFSNPIALLALTFLSTIVASPIPGQALVDRDALNALENRDGPPSPPWRGDVPAPSLPGGVTGPPWRDDQPAPGPVVAPVRREAQIGKVEGITGPPWRDDLPTPIVVPGPVRRGDIEAGSVIGPGWRRSQ